MDNNINRYIVECKEKLLYGEIKIISDINRYIVECKGLQYDGGDCC